MQGQTMKVSAWRNSGKATNILLWISPYVLLHKVVGHSLVTELTH